MIGVTRSGSVLDIYLQFYIVIGKATLHIETSFPEATEVLRMGTCDLQTKPYGNTCDLFHP
jgi:hypothetical protein